MKQGQIVSDVLKRKITETEESSEVKRIKINPAETTLQTEMDNIFDEEWKRVSLGIEKQTRAVHLKATDVTQTKGGEFGSDLKRTIINKSTSDSKPSTSGNVSGSKVVSESQQQKMILSDSASRVKQDQTAEKPRVKHRRWDDSEKADKGRKYDDDDDKRTHRKQSPSHRSTKTPPRSYRQQTRSKVSPPGVLRRGRRSLTLKDDKDEKDYSAGKDVGRKASAPAQSRDVIVIDDSKQKQNAAAKAEEKSVEVKAQSSSQPTSSLSTVTTATTTSASLFKFNWMSKSAKSALMLKSGVQCGPMPGRKPAAKGTTTFSNNVYYSLLCLHLVVCLCYS